MKRPRFCFKCAGRDNHMFTLPFAISALLGLTGGCGLACWSFWRCFVTVFLVHLLLTSYKAFLAIFTKTNAVEAYAISFI